MKPILLALALAGLLSACASSPRTPDYECPLYDVQGAKCASMEDSYKAARNMTRGDHSRVQSVFDRRVQSNAPDAQPMFAGQPSNYPEPGQQGMPVFKQPKVVRAWVAPYVDADGNLRSGEYTYFATPGQWNYGTLNKPGAAAGAFEPSKPSNYGFNPVQSGSAVKTAPAAGNGDARPSAPPEAQAAAKNAQQSQSQAAPQADSITQPYQRLGN